jgi:hypothetical protein
MSKKAFWIPIFLHWAAIVALACGITYHTQCPADLNGHIYTIYACGTLKPVTLIFVAYIIWQLFVMVIANRFVDPEYADNAYAMNPFFFLRRVNNPFIQKAERVFESVEYSSVGTVDNLPEVDLEKSA